MTHGQTAENVEPQFGASLNDGVFDGILRMESGESAQKNVFSFCEKTALKELG
jgi:hypothetical protein